MLFEMCLYYVDLFSNFFSSSIILLIRRKKQREMTQSNKIKTDKKNCSLFYMYLWRILSIWKTSPRAEEMRTLNLFCGRCCCPLSSKGSWTCLQYKYWYPGPPFLAYLSSLVICLLVGNCAHVFKLFNIFSFRTAGLISTKLNTKHP